jgi:hypothetical protein
LLRARAAAILVLLVFGGFTWGDDSVPTVVVRPFLLPVPETSDLLPRSLEEALANALRHKGFVVVDGSDAHPARFEAQGLLVRENGNLVLHVALTDLDFRSVVAAQMISVYDGLTALGPINTSMAAAVQTLKVYWDSIQKSPLPVPPIQDSLVFSSADEGAEVFWQGHQSIGKISQGRVTAPYYPFPSRAVLTLTVEKEGYTANTVEIRLRPDRSTYPLPKLVKLRIDELHLFLSTGRLLGMGFEYRHYFLPDWSFWAGEAYPFVQWQPNSAGVEPVGHLDLAGSAGTWILFPASSWFRFGLETSLLLSQTLTSPSAGLPSQWYLDASVIPFGVLMEWNFWGITLENRIQVPYSLGLPTGLLAQRWLLVDNTFPMLSFGTVLKW